MSDLAFNLSGEPFSLPPTAAGWRVRRMKPKGAPEVVYGADGAPLVLPVDADLSDLRREAKTPGRYRLDPIDDRQQPIGETQAAYLYVHAEAPPAPALAHEPARATPLESALVELARLNTSLAQSVISQFPAMMDSAAGLLRAADGAGLPARPPMALDDDNADGEDLAEDEPTHAAPKPGTDLAAVVAQTLPALVMALTSRGTGGAAAAGTVPAAPAARPTTTARDGAPSPTAAGPSSAQATQAAAPTAASTEPMAPEVMAHFVAIQQALTLEERALAQALVSELSPADVRAWLQELAALAVPAAVHRIRGILHGTSASTDDLNPSSPSTSGGGS